MTRVRDGRGSCDLRVPTPRRGPAAARRSSPAARRGTSTRSEQRRSTRPGAERADRSVGAPRSTPPRRSGTPRRGLPAGHSSPMVLPKSPVRNQDRQLRSAGVEDIRALCNALCNGLHSARPLIPDSAVLFRASWIRPRPPYVPSSLGLAGSDPVREWNPDRGSAGGRSGQQTARQRTEQREKKKQNSSNNGTARRAKGRGVPWACEAWRVEWLA
jgi:hypothetical protein